MAYQVEQYPVYSGSTAIAGKKFLLYVAHNDKWNLIGGCRNNGIELGADSIDASSKDNGGWGESIPGMRSWSSSPNLVVKTNNPGMVILEDWVLNEDLQNQRPALRFAFVNTQDKKYFDGWGTISNFSIDAPHDGVMSKDMTINGVGPLTPRESFAAETVVPDDGGLGA